MDSIGENKYVVCTSLPHTMLADYQARFPKDTVEVRQIYDVRDDYDAFILGGGGLSWGFGWRQAINAFSHDKPSMNYGVGYDWHRLYSARMNNLYTAFLRQFDAITVRDRCSQVMANEIGSVQTLLTACPSINLKEEKFDCPKGMVAVCPRYEDYEPNDEQLDWLVNRLKNIEDEVLLIPLAPFNSEGMAVDYALCLELKKRLKGSQLLNLTDSSNPRRIKYAISQSKLVVSGGRYHAIVWAVAHGIPYEISPTSSRYPKVGAFVKMDSEFGSDKLKEMEKNNTKTFQGLLRNDKHT